MLNSLQAPAQSKIVPEKVTKPIQLLAAWLLGLTFVDATFLAVALSLGTETWQCGALVIAAILNVPLFLGAVFLLQTRFRPELQEDSYYAEYLSKKTNEVVKVSRIDVIEKEVELVRAELSEERARQVALSGGSDSWRWRVGLNRKLSDVEAWRGALRTAGIPLAAFFGSSDDPGRDVALAHNIDFESKMRILRLSYEREMRGYIYFGPEDEMIEEDVLIGCYGGPRYLFDASFKQLIESEPEEADLELFESIARDTEEGE